MVTAAASPTHSARGRGPRSSGSPSGTSAGPRTSSRTASSKAPSGACVSSVCSSRRLLGPPSSYVTDRQSGPEVRPLRVAQRYSSTTGMRSTSTVAVKAGADPAGGGQLPV